MIIENIYYLTFLWLLILMAIPVGKKRYKYILALIPMIFISLFRFGQGIDYFSYEFLYNNQIVSSFGSMLDHQVRFETGFRTLIYIFKNLGLSFQYFAAFMSISIVVFFSIWIYKNSENPLLSIFFFYGMFFLVWALSALRQGFVLSIGTFLFFNRNRPIKHVWLEVLIILMLSTIHFSALIYLMIIILREFEFTKKQLIFLLAVSLVFTFIPVKGILESIPVLPFKSKILRFAGEGQGFLDFAGLIRLVFSLYSLFLLYRYEWDDFEYKVISSTILGFAIYFAMKFNEVFAGRTVAYTFVLYPIIFVWHINKVSDKLIKNILIFSMVIFSISYFQKDVSSGQGFQGVLEPSKFIKFKSITSVTNEDYWKYDNQYSFYTYYYKKSKADFLEFHANNYIELVPYDERLGHFIAKSPRTRAFGVVNEQGDWVVNPEYKRKPTLHHDIIQLTTDGGLGNIEYIDAFNKYKSKKEVLSSVDQSLVKKQRVLEDTPEFSKPDLESMKEILTEVFPKYESVSDVSLMKFSQPFTYYIMQIKYHNYNIFLYLDESMNLLNKNVYLDLNRFDSEGILWAKNFFSNEAINIKGDVIFNE